MFPSENEETANIHKETLRETGLIESKGHHQFVCSDDLLEESNDLPYVNGIVYSPDCCREVKIFNVRRVAR